MINYCPDDAVTRAQMAVFLLRTEHGQGYAPPACTGVFGDVECSPSPAFAVDWIEQLAKEGITGGCSVSPPMYCPSEAVTRAQMAVFLLRVEHGSSYTPPTCVGVFADVSCPSGFAVDWIEQLFNEGITGGCGAVPTPTPTVPAPTPTPTPPPPIVVTIQNLSFTPATVNVKVGQTVQWKWVSGTHSTTSGSCPPCNPDGHWDSGVHSSGATFSHTFTSADKGTRPYYCSIHTIEMTGTVQVN